MKIFSAKDAKYGFGRLIDVARSEPVVIAKHGRPVVVVVAVEEYERLTGADVVDVRAKSEATKTVEKSTSSRNQKK